MPVTRLTGFLGPGNTIPLNDILADATMQGTAVVINEFGTVPIDHDLVRKPKMDVPQNEAKWREISSSRWREA